VPVAAMFFASVSVLMLVLLVALLRARRAALLHVYKLLLSVAHYAKLAPRIRIVSGS